MAANNLFTTYGQGAPLFYDHINVANSLVQPSTVHSRNTALTRFFERYLMLEAISVFKWELPKNWFKPYFEYVLYMWGVGAVFETDKYGIVFNACTLRGYGFYYQPTHAIVSNPHLKRINELQIGKNCELVKLSPDWCGIYDLISYYADMMSLAATVAGVNLFNSRLAYVFACTTPAAKQAFAEMYDQITEGNPATFVDKSLFNKETGEENWKEFTNDLSKNYIVSDVLSDLRRIKEMFLTDIGIPNANTDKKQRLNVDEVNSNNVEVRTKAELWLETLQECFENVNNMFGTNCKVDWRLKPDEAYDTLIEEEHNTPKAQQR